MNASSGQGKGARDPRILCSGKAEPGIISGVADHDHDAVAETPALAEPCFDKGCTDTHALVILVDPERGKRKRGGLDRAGDNSDRDRTGYAR